MRHLSKHTIECYTAWVVDFLRFAVHRGINLADLWVAAWGEHLGTWPADHFHTINKRWVLELKDPTGDIAPYYVRAVSSVLRTVAGPCAPAGA